MTLNNFKRFSFIGTLILVSLVAILGLTRQVRAQETNTQLAAATAQSCSDYSPWGKVSLVLNAGNDPIGTGIKQTFNGTITNGNSYPIVYGGLYVRMVRTNGSPDVPSKNGNDIVDQFMALDNFTIPANGSIPVSFTWQVPAYAIVGNYQAQG